MINKLFSLCFLTTLLFFPAAMLNNVYAQGGYTGSGAVSQGLATVTTANLFPGCTGARVSAVASIISSDGKTRIIPAATEYLRNKFLPDLYNQCSGVTPSSISGVNFDLLPLNVIDSTGDIITGLIFGDNYYEMYINGILIGCDPVPYTPFNSSVVKFKVKRPYTIAFKLVDWEENMGVGTELNNGNPYHTGDGGFIAKFSDGTITDTSWRVQTFYIAPIGDLSTVVELADGTRSTATAVTAPACSTRCYAVHYDIPDNWNRVTFNDRVWPKASIYTPAQVGGNNPAYVNFAASWGSAQFIWSSNLLLDNLVLVRKTVGSITSADKYERSTVGNNLNAVVFPNPFSNEAKLRVTAPGTGRCTITVSDIVGKVVLQTRHDISGEGVFSMPLSAEHLATGMYFITIEYKGMTQSVKYCIVK